MVKNFAFKWRVIEPWHEPDGISLFSHSGNIFSWADMLKPRESSLLGRYVAQVHDWGFNTMAIWGDPEQNPEAMRKFASYLKKRDIKMFLCCRKWSDAEAGCFYPLLAGNVPMRFSGR